MSNEKIKETEERLYEEIRRQERARRFNPDMKTSIGTQVRMLSLHRSLFDLILNKKGEVESDLKHAEDNPEVVARDKYNKMTRAFTELRSRAKELYKRISVLEGEIKEKYHIGYLNDVIMLADVSNVEELVDMEHEIRCKDCGKLLYKLKGYDGSARFEIEAHCRECKKPVATSFGHKETDE